MSEAWRAYRGGAALIGRDPVRILFPTGGLLLIDLLFTWALWGALPLPWGELAWRIALLVLVREAAGLPLRAWFWSAAAGALGLRARPLRRLPSLALVRVTGGLVQALAMGSLALIPLAISAYLLPRGAWLGSALALALAALLASLGGVMARGLWAFAELEAVAGAGGPWASVSRSASLAARHPLAVLAALLAGDVALSLGALAGGAGALPAWPWPKLVMLHLWAPPPRGSARPERAEPATG
ncbi:MAG: hypothetical protein JXX28_10870 [Deltaproteobacteria bacterium]|nr:hypothetical protein [Deltaproteobacteria bacterium]